MEIKRNRYLNTLISKKHNGLIKVITGMRRCGKSYLLFTLFKDHLLSDGIDEDHIMEIAFDAFENKKYRDPDVLYPYLKEQIKDDAMYYVLLDEVQLLGEFESILNSLIRMKNVDVYVTGSNARFLSKDVITEFRGRGDEVHMYPLSFAEFMSVYPGTKQDGWNEYMLYGGIPLVLEFTTPDQKIAFLKSLFEETYISDIVGRHNIRNKAELEELLNILSSAIGSLTNPQKLSENIIFNELKMRGFNVDVGVIMQYETNEKGANIRKQLEIDFVCNQGSKRYYIQSAYAIPDQAKMEQEQRSLMLTGDFFKRMIITKDTPAPYYNESGVLIMSVYDFLLNENSLNF